MNILSRLSLAMLVASNHSSNYPMLHCDFLRNYANYLSVVGNYLFTKEMMNGVNMAKLSDEQWQQMKVASYEVARDNLYNVYQFSRYYFTQNVGGYSQTAELMGV